MVWEREHDGDHFGHLQNLLKYSMMRVDLDNSRPFDVHKWSEHPESNEFVDVVWDNFVAQHYQVTGRGKRPKSLPKVQLKVLLLDLYVCWRENSEQFIGVGMSKTFYRAGSRYNELHISEITISLVHRLADNNLIEIHPGTEGAGRVTRIRAIGMLSDLFLHSALSLYDIYSHRDREVIILNDDNSNAIEYDDQDFPGIPLMRDELKTYNSLLERTFIDRPDLEEPFIDLGTNVVRITPGSKLVRRVFYRGSWELGGRFHGGWWQRINGEQRKLIHIDDQLTTEVDYKSLHINLLYVLNGNEPPEDPYEIQPLYHLFEEVEDRRKLAYYNRSLIKQLVLYAINGGSEASAFQAFRSNQEIGSPFKALSNDNLRQFVDAFLEKNPIVRNHLYSDQGVFLMNIDGKITSCLINHFTNMGVPILTIHDSYIIQQEYSKELKEQMQVAVSAVIGNDIQIPVEEGNVFIYKFFDGENEEFDYDYADLPDDHPIYQKTKGYMKRYELHRRWIARQ